MHLCILQPSCLRATGSDQSAVLHSHIHTAWHCKLRLQQCCPSARVKVSNMFRLHLEQKVLAPLWLDTAPQPWRIAAWLSGLIACTKLVNAPVIEPARQVPGLWRQALAG